MAKSKVSKLIVIRVLSALHYQGCNYIPNQLVELEDTDAETLLEYGLVDDDSDAIDYCKKCGAEVVKHQAVGENLEAGTANESTANASKEAAVDTKDKQAEGA